MGADIAASVSESPPSEIASLRQSTKSFDSRKLRSAALDFQNGDSEAEIFAVQTPAHMKSKHWIPDIAEIFSTKFSSWTFIPQYIEQNPEMSGDNLQKVLNQLKGIESTQIGVIELSEKLDIDVVTDIFIRINSKGTPLSQGDFVMSSAPITRFDGVL